MLPHGKKDLSRVPKLALNPPHQKSRFTKLDNETEYTEEHNASLAIRSEAHLSSVVNETDEGEEDPQSLTENRRHAMGMPNKNLKGVSIKID